MPEKYDQAGAPRHGRSGSLKVSVFPLFRGFSVHCDGSDEGVVICAGKRFEDTGGREAGQGEVRILREELAGPLGGGEVHGRREERQDS